MHDAPELVRLGDEIAAYAKPRASARLRVALRRSLASAPARERRAGFAALLPRLAPALAVAAILVALVPLGASAAAASLPGDPAFALRRGVETLEVAIAPDDAARLNLLVEQADRRLSDVHAALATRPSAVQAAVSEYALAVSRIDAAADALRRAAPSPRRDASLALAAAASESQVEILRTLSARLPEAAQPGIQRAIDAHQRIHTPRR